MSENRVIIDDDQTPSLPNPVPVKPFNKEDLKKHIYTILNLVEFAAKLTPTDYDDKAVAIARKFSENELILEIVVALVRYFQGNGNASKEGFVKYLME